MSPARAMDRSLDRLDGALSDVLAGWRAPAQASRALVGAALFAALMSAALTTGIAGVLAGARPASTPALRSNAPHNELARLPLAAQAPVSAALGAVDPIYRVGASGGRLEATLPGQGLHVAFGRSGVLLSSGALRSGSALPGTAVPVAARVGLSLRAVGFGNALRAAGRPVLHHDANSVRYARDGLDEWYADGPLGLEQGFTFSRAPARRAAGPLTLSLALSGDMRASLSPGGQVLTLARGSSSLRYAGLAASEARGRALPVWMALAGKTLLVRVDDRGARYPVRIDPLIQQGPKLTAEAGSRSGFFGASVALSADGNTALIGAPSIKKPGGTAWVFTRSGATWRQQGPMLTGEEGATGPESCEPSEEAGECGFGRSVALSADGNTALIGAPRYAGNEGAAWVFTRSGSTWTRGMKLVGQAESGEGRFGRSVALSGDGKTALIGGPTDHKKKEGAQSEGAVWAFRRSGDTWAQSEKLNGEAPELHFGGSVALSADGSVGLVGAAGAGAAWVIARTGSSWTKGPELTGDEDSGFGASIALSADGNTALLGNRSAGGRAGAAWVFARSRSTWSQQGAKITGNDEVGEGEFGASVALSVDGDTAAIGGPTDNGPDHQGAVWVYTRAGSNWVPHERKHVGREQDGNGLFGFSVALSATSAGETVLVGGPHDDSKLGAAWVFDEAAEEETLEHEEKSKKEPEEPDEKRGSGGGGSGAGGSGAGSSGAGAAALSASTGVPGGVLPFGPVASPSCKLALISRRLTVQSNSRVALELKRAAGAAACSGTLKLTVKVKVKSARRHVQTRTIGAGSFSIAPAKVELFRVKLNSTGRALLKAGHGRLAASLVIVSLSPRPAHAQSASVGLTFAKKRPSSTRGATHGA